MSSSRRIDLRVVAVACALGGCMKIYPDPELPDVEATWFDGDCIEGGGEVQLSLIGVDDPSKRTDVTVPCADAKYTFADVARERFRVEGTLRSMDGDVFGMSTQDVDLRNGLDREAYLYFGSFGFDNVTVRWTFDAGASCSSLAADSVWITVSDPVEGELFADGMPCEFGVYRTQLPAGTFTVHAEAHMADVPVAVSPETPPFDVVFDKPIDLGTLVLTPL